MTSQLLQEAYGALSVEKSDLLVRQVRACAAHVPTYTVLTTFEPKKMGGTTLSMSDYAGLLTVTPTVLESILRGSTTGPHQAALLWALLSLRGLTSTLFYHPSIASDGEHAIKTKPTVQDLQRLGEKVMQDIRSLSVFRKSWEKPTVHRFLELIYRTLPLIQLGPSM